MPEQCQAKFGDFIVIRDLTENQDWLGKVFCVEVKCADPFDPFGGCCPPGKAEVFYHYVAAKHVGRINARDAEWVLDKCDMVVLGQASSGWWGRWVVPCGRADFIEKSKEWDVWSKVGCLRNFRPPGFEQETGGLIGGCGQGKFPTPPRCCPPKCV